MDTLAPVEPSPPPAATTATAAGPPGPTRVCLVIVFNHRYEGNLPTLDRLYGERFKNVRYLMPFYRGSRPDVFPVYNSSFHFQGFFMAAWQRLRDEGFTHFVFSGDDLLLNPGLNGENLCARLGVGLQDGYIKDLRPATDMPLHWHHLVRGLISISNVNGIHWQHELPDADAARANLESKGYRFGRFGWRTLSKGVDDPMRIPQLLYYLFTRLRARRRDPQVDLLGLPYPLLAGYSDLILVPGTAMDNFCFYCSVFAAMGVFVEMALPTALALTCARVVRQSDTSWRSVDAFDEAGRVRRAGRPRPALRSSLGPPAGHDGRGRIVSPSHQVLAVEILSRARFSALKWSD